MPPTASSPPAVAKFVAGDSCAAAVLLHRDPDAADRLVPHRDREVRRGRLLRDRREPPLGIVERVRVGEPVAQVDPDLAVVRMPDDRLPVPPAPAPDRAASQVTLHESASSSPSTPRPTTPRTARAGIGFKPSRSLLISSPSCQTIVPEREYFSFRG